GLRRLGVPTLRDEDFARERQRADVVGLDGRDALEGSERGFAMTLLAQGAGLLPEELGQLHRIIGDLQAAGDEREQPVVLPGLANASEKAIEGRRPRRVAQEGLLEGELAPLRLAQLDQCEAGALPVL